MKEVEVIDREKVKRESIEYDKVTRVLLNIVCFDKGDYRFNIADVSAMLKRIDVNMIFNGRPLIWYAFKYKTYFKCLVDAGADINVKVDKYPRDNGLDSPFADPKSLLVHALEHDDREAIKLLVENGANVNEELESGLPLLWYVIRSNRYDHFGMLLNGRGLDVKNMMIGVYPLLYQVLRCGAHYNNNHCMLSLIIAGADVNAIVDGKPLLYHALEFGNNQCVAALLGGKVSFGDVLDLAKYNTYCEDNKICMYVVKYNEHCKAPAFSYRDCSEDICIFGSEYRYVSNVTVAFADSLLSYWKYEKEQQNKIDESDIKRNVGGDRQTEAVKENNRMTDEVNNSLLERVEGSKKHGEGRSDNDTANTSSVSKLFSYFGLGGSDQGRTKTD